MSGELKEGTMMESPLRILHLEDDPKDAELIQAMLETEGISCYVTRVETQADFSASLEQGGFDLILADYTLPSFDGLSALKITQEKCPDIPFIFVSGTLNRSTRDWYTQAATLACSSAAMCSTAAVTAGS
jgi:CheY-like chemotaxis protein